jgi:hypothetical protein
LSCLELHRGRRQQLMPVALFQNVSFTGRPYVTAGPSNKKA